MMNEEVSTAHRLIRQGEGQSIEFKKKANHPEKIVREVVAFANASGGNLFIGVDDNGSVSGLKFPEDEEYVLSKAIQELIRPSVEFEVNYLTMKNDAEILHYKIPEGKNKPYFALLEKKHRYGKSFIRVDDHSIQTSYEMRQILKFGNQKHEPIVFEDRVKELFDYFKNHKGITLHQYSELSGMDRKLASRKLVDLALSGALRVEPREGGDIFLPAD
ncbi:MAG: ATP-binding protein [Bacteroidota bacterium]